MKKTLITYCLTFCLIIQLVRCSSRTPNKLIQKEINFLTGPAYLNDLFQNKDVEVKLKYENTAIGRFKNATPEHIILQTLSEVKYLPINKINSITVNEKKISLDWLIMAMGSSGAIIGSISRSENRQNDQHDLSENFSSITQALRGIIMGSMIGALTGYIIDRSITQIQATEYLTNSSPVSNSVKIRAFNASQLMQTWNFMGVKFPTKNSKIKKLLHLSKLVILDDLIGEQIDAEENKKYQLFPNIPYFYKAYLFKLIIPKREKNKYFTIILTKLNRAKFKMLKTKNILDMKFKIE